MTTPEPLNSALDLLYEATQALWTLPHTDDPVLENILTDAFDHILYYLGKLESYLNENPN